MKRFTTITSVFILFYFVGYSYSEDVLLQVFLKKPINVVSNNFVSFSIDPEELLDLVSQPTKLVSACACLQITIIAIITHLLFYIIVRTLQDLPQKWVQAF